jgi:Transposase
MCNLQPRVRTERRRCAPDTFPCPTCGAPGRRKGLHTRTVRCLAYREVLLIELTVGEYRASCSCRKTFRSQVDGILPRAEYSNKVREAVLDRLLDDKMSAERLRRSLSRDFHLDLSDGADYRQWAIERFSGTLCLDEIHLGKKALLLATDPINDFPVAFALVGKNDHGHMRRFLNNLKRWGFLPGVVVTDGSNLYPALLAEVWPAARHQLCVFHVLMDISAKVLDAVKRLRRQKARRGNACRKRPKGRRRKGAKKRRGLTAKDQAHFVFKRRYLIVKRRENLSEREKKDLVTMLEYIPQLRVLRQFVDRVLRLFEPQQSEHQARCRRAALLREAAFAAVPELKGAMEMLSEERFAKMVAFVHSPANERVRTNNHVERVNRQLRYLEKVRYKWRRRRTIVRFVLLALERWRQRRGGQPSPASVNPSAGRPGHPPATPAGHRSAA